MGKFSNMRIGTKIVSLTGVLCVLLLATVIASFSLSDQINTTYQKVYRGDAKMAVVAMQAGKAFSEDRGELTRYLFRQSPEARQQSLSELQAHDSAVEAQIAQLQALAVTGADQQAMAELERQMQQYKQARAALIAAQTVPGSPVENLPEMKPVHDLGGTIGASLNDFATRADEKAQQEMQAEGAYAKRVVLAAGAIAVVALIVSLLIGVALARSISRRMEQLGEDARAIAGGDLTHVVALEAQDEIGMVAANFEKMRGELDRSMQAIRMASGQVAAGAKNVSDASVSLSQGAAEQASSVEELSSSIAEIASQTKSNAENADHANELTGKARVQAQNGDKEMKEMLRAMEAINVSSANISKIIKVIDEIAFQTNILALNAAVEAARAGSHGKGFAVVAEEVRNLAARSAKAAKETTDMIEDSIAKVNDGRTIASKTAEKLEAIMTHVEDVASLVEGIAKASNEQQLALEQINQGVLQVSQVVQSNSSTSEQAASASEELSAQAASLKDTAGKFRLTGRPERWTEPAARPETDPAGAPAPKETAGEHRPPQEPYLPGGFGKY